MSVRSFASIVLAGLLLGAASHSPTPNGSTPAVPKPNLVAANVGGVPPAQIADIPSFRGNVPGFGTWGGTLVATNAAAGLVKCPISIGYRANVTFAPRGVGPLSPGVVRYNWAPSTSLAGNYTVTNAQAGQAGVSAPLTVMATITYQVSSPAAGSPVSFFVELGQSAKQQLRVVSHVACAGDTSSIKDYQNPPLPEPSADPYVELPTINQITNPPAAGQAFQPCNVKGSSGSGAGASTGAPKDNAGVDVRQTVIFDPSVSEPPSIDTTTDAWLANCNDSIENEDADETVPKDLKNQVMQGPEPVLDPATIPPPPASQLCGGALPATAGNSTARRAPVAPAPIVCAGGPQAPKTCDRAGELPDCALDCSLPFCGRDVILVHGYRLGPLGDWYTDYNNGSLSTWPADAAQFKPGGYWFEGAIDYWEDYIVHKLAAGYYKSPNIRRMPRVLTIAYPVSQRLTVAVDAMLSQINDAINCTVCANTNVYTVERGGLAPVELNATNDTRGGVPFCTLQCVIVSHSTGGPVVNVAMDRAHTSGGIGSPDPCNATVPASSQWVRISDCYIKAHVAIEPAFSGSNHATELFVAATLAGQGPARCAAFVAALALETQTGGITFTSAPGTCAKAALRTGETSTTDLLPFVMTHHWQPLMAQSTVPTLIVATAHPTSMWTLMWGPLFPGFSDNTVTMDSQLGRLPIDTVHFPYVWRPYEKVQSRRFLIDRDNAGRWPIFLSSGKAFGYYVEQTNLFRPNLIPMAPTQVSAAANPHLTPTGMHIPVTAGGTIQKNSVGAGMGPNTYTFIQAAASHFWRWRFGESSVSDWQITGCNYTGSPQVEQGFNYQHIGAGNYSWQKATEESRAVFDKSLYLHASQNPRTWNGTGPDGIPLVSPTMQNAVEGQTVTSYWQVKIPFHGTVKDGIHWQRTYYRLKNWECKDYLDYINDFAVRL